MIKINNELFGDIMCSVDPIHKKLRKVKCVLIPEENVKIFDYKTE